MKRADYAALRALILMLSALDLLASIPLAVRQARRAIRQTTKRALLWINACRYQESEHEVSRLEVLRQDAVRLIREQREHQVRLQEQRNRISGW
jgi:hypothetical protein